jgi:hypothetical protein
MIVFSEPSQSYQYFRVRTAPQGCSAPFDARLLVTDAETNQSASYAPTTLFYDNYGFLNVEAQMILTQDTYYKLEIIQLSGSADCNTIYRGELYYTSASSTSFDAKPFKSYENTPNDYTIWRSN